MAKMKNAPVYFTVVQVRFNPILNMEPHLPVIQDKMRQSGFPDYRKEVVQQLVFQAGSQTAPPAVSNSPRFVFGCADSSAEFGLESNSLSYMTFSYDTHETFFKTFLDGLAAIHVSLAINFVERVGLRYFDAILPREGETLSDYLTPEVTGLCNKLNGKLVHSYSETIMSIDTDKLITRCLIRDGQVTMPPDMAPLSVKINPKFTKRKGIHGIIDTDAFYETRTQFSIESINAKLNSLHAEIVTSFKKTITDHAETVWK